jgi:cell division protein ZapB
MQHPRLILFSLLGNALLLLGLLFFWWSSQNREEQIRVEKDENALIVANITNDLLVISRELDLRIEETRRLGGRIEILEEIKADLEKEIQNLQDRNIVNLLKIASLTGQIRDYEATLQGKNREINTLLSTTQTLESQNRKLAGARDSLSKTVEAYEEKEQILREKAGLAARLKTRLITMHGVNRRGNESDDLRVRQIEELIIRVTIEANFAAVPEPKEVFIALVDPSGKIVKGKNPDPNTQYSANKQFSFTLDEASLEFRLEGVFPLQPGNYLVRVLEQDYVLGEQIFILK